MKQKLNIVLLLFSILLAGHSMAIENRIPEQKVDLTPEKGTGLSYQGQYEDSETGLYYNRFRYYDAEAGMYISQDPIGLEGGNPNIYAYVHDLNSWIDPLGLSKKSVCELRDARAVHDLSQEKINKLKNLSDDELLNAFNNPKTGEFVELNDIGGIAQGHHRINEIIRRADDPSSSITNSTLVTVEKYKRDLSMFFDM